jgi:DNA polymerase III epsilon subunit-like protein
MSQEELWNALRRDAAPRPPTFAEQHVVDRAAAVQWARDLVAHPDTWVVLDSETTGLGRDAEIVQIGVVAPDGGVLLDALIKPRYPVPADAYRIHGIGDGNLTLAVTFPQVDPTLRAALNGRRVIIYNASFDMRILTGVRANHGIPPYNAVSWECAMIRYSEVRGVANDGRNPANKTAYKWMRLPALDASKAHGAVADCLSTIEIIKRMAEG